MDVSTVTCLSFSITGTLLKSFENLISLLALKKNRTLTEYLLWGQNLSFLIPGARTDCFIISPTGPDTVSIFLNAAPDPAPFAITLGVTKKNYRSFPFSDSIIQSNVTYRYWYCCKFYTP